MRTVHCLALACLIVTAPAFAQQAPVKQDPAATMSPDDLTIRECLGILAGLNALDGRRVIVSAGKPTETAETVSYKFAGKLRNAISHNIFVLGQVQQEAQAANRREMVAVGKGEAIATGSKDNIEFDRRMNEYTERPCKADLEHIRDDDLRLNENDIPGSVLALLWKIRDK